MTYRAIDYEDGRSTMEAVGRPFTVRVASAEIVTLTLNLTLTLSLSLTRTLTRTRTRALALTLTLPRCAWLRQRSSP